MTTLTIHRLQNKQGTSLELLNYGATLYRVLTKDKNGELRNIILSLSSPEAYLTQKTYLGASIGRVAGRTSQGVWGAHQLERNEGLNHLHGGTIGFESRYFSAQPFKTENSQGVTFSYDSPDGENGYPGNLHAEICYTLYEDNHFTIEYTGETDAMTLFNPTNHAYFNLSGETTIAQHVLSVKSTAYLPINAENLPSGSIHSVTDTGFDLQSPAPLSEILTKPDIKAGNGLNHPFMLEEKAPQIHLASSKSGIDLQIGTTYPCTVLYTGSHFNNDFQLDNGHAVSPYAGIAFETQLPPDAIHHPAFGDIQLHPGEKFHAKTSYQLGIF